MKITVKQLKALIKEQVEEMSHDDILDRKLEQGNLTGNFSLNIELGNDGMMDKFDISTALNRLQSELRTGRNIGERSGAIMDINGNKVGSWKIG